MKFFIGSSNRDFRERLVTRFHGHAGDFYVAFDFPAAKLPAALTALLMEVILPRALSSAFQNADSLPAETDFDQSVTDALRKNKTIAAFRRILCHEIRLLCAEHTPIHIEGLLFFRLRTQLTELYRAIQSVILQVCSDATGHRHLLLLLREHIRSRTPHCNALRVVETVGEFLIYDDNDTIIRCDFPEEYTPEEHLINSLLFLSPAVLDLSALHDAALKSILSEIFAGRLI